MLPVLGREAELARIDEFLRDADGVSALLIEGAAGIGKTTLWRHGVSTGANLGRRVLAAQPLEAEAEMAFAGLDSLLGSALDEVADELSEPHRVALDIALLRVPHGGRPLEPRAVDGGTLVALRVLAEREPLLIAIDDVHWVDKPSLRALRHALHRLDQEDVLVLSSARREAGTPDLGLDRDRTSRLGLGPLGLGELREIVRLRLGEWLSSPAAARLEELSAGSPFYALELARMSGQGSARWKRPLAAADLRELVGNRIAALPEATVAALAVVAALATPDTKLVTQMLGEEAVLDPAFAAEILEQRDNELRFAHPLLAEASYAAVPPAARRAMHRRLAEAVRDPEERARHLAASAAGPDPEVANALEQGAAAASARGAPSAAAELLEGAARLTPPDDPESAARRRLEASIRHFEAGDGVVGTQICRELVDSLPPGGLRADALTWLGSYGLLSLDENTALCERAVEEAVTHEQRARCLLNLAIVRDLHDLERANQTAAAALELIDPMTDPAMRAWGLSILGRSEYFSRPARELPAALYQALELEREHGTIAPDHYVTAPAILGVGLMMRDRLDEGRELLASVRVAARAAGDLTGAAGIALHLTELECRAGDLPQARAYADEGLAAADEGTVSHTLGALSYARALVAAHEGEVELARELATRGRQMGEEVGDTIFPVMNSWALGFLELSLGNPETALTHLDGLLERWHTLRFMEPGVAPFMQDRIDALIAAGHIEQADEALEKQDELARELQRPRLLAAGARERGLIAAARGDLSAALDHLQQALEHHADLPVPNQRARTLLALGATLRRAGRRRDARAALDEALGTFEAVGERLWADRAREEAARLGGRTPAGDELTPAERRVAELVAEGRSNREVADALYVTVRTVEANLTRIYSKLNLRSRAELAARWHAGSTSGSSTPGPTPH